MVFFAMLALIGLDNYLLKQKMAACQTDLALKNYQLNQIDQLSKEQQQKIVEAQKTAEKTRSTTIQDAKRLLNSDAGSTCNQAIDWGIKEAGALGNWR